MAEAKKRTVTTPRLQERYRKEVLPALKEQFKYDNLYQAPRLTKVVLNMGLGEGSQDSKIIEQSVEELATISGQRPVVTRAKKAISNFKLRKGQAVGAKVTLRRQRMYEFLDRLMNVAMPRSRDFRGVDPKGFDEAGNFSFGLTEQLIFPEIDYDSVSRTQGMNVNICSSATSQEEGLALLKALGMPFKE
jgi:large subunit ribosomal protein L5